MDIVRILYFHQYFSTPRGAAGTRSYEMARRMLARGHQVLVVCGSAERGETGIEGPFRDGCRRGSVDGIEVLEFELGYSNRDGLVQRTAAFLRFARRSIGVALREEYDLIFATTTPLTAALPGIFARWLRGKPFVFEVRDLWPELPRAMGVITNPVVLGVLSLLEWSSYHSADRLIGLAPGIVDGIAQRGVPEARIALVPNGCDLDLFSGGGPGARPDAVPPEALMAVFTGAHGIANGLDAVLDAAAELQRRGRDDIRLVLVGEGKLKRSLQQRAAADGLKNVVFLDSVPKERLVELMKSADVGLQILANVPAFYRGTSPNKFFDYLAAGRPVLINYPGWLADVVREFDCGWAVPPDDAGAFADALVHAADRRSTVAEMGRRARALAERRFARDVLADHFVDWVCDPSLLALRGRLA